MELHERLTALRKKKGLSQLALAEALDVSRQAISKWESGRSAPSTENLLRLSAIYGVPVDVLVNCALPLPDLEPEEAPEPEEPAPKKGLLSRIVESRWYNLCALIIFWLLLINLGRTLYKVDAYARFVYPMTAEELIAEYDSDEDKSGLAISADFWPNTSSKLFPVEFPEVPSEYHASLHRESGLELLFEQEFPERTYVRISHDTKRGEARFIVARGEDVVEELTLRDLPWEISLEPGSYRFFLASKQYTGKLDLTMDWPSLRER